MKTIVWVLCFESPEIPVGIHSHQLLSKATELVQGKDASVCAICIGNFNKSLSKYGVDEIIHIDSECINYRQISSLLKELYCSEEDKPSLVLFPATKWGKCIAADLAIKIGAGLTAECIDIESDNECQFTFTRAAINSTVLAQIKCVNTRISMCTCKKDVFAATELNNKVVPVRKFASKMQLSFQTPAVLHSELEDNKENNVELEQSRIVFGVGRGVKDLNLITRVAKKYNAAIAGTRAVVEEGLIDKKSQVGQSGINISPDLYVAIGISGATQHTVGIKNAKKIIAVNTDPNAMILAYSDYCIIDDYTKIFEMLGAM